MKAINTNLVGISLKRKRDGEGARNRASDSFVINAMWANAQWDAARNGTFYTTSIQ
jgi:hypothetical protein